MVQKYPIVYQHSMPQFEDLPQVLLLNPRQNPLSKLSPFIFSVLWHASCASSSSSGKKHAVAYQHLVFQFCGMLPGFFHPYQVKRIQQLTPSSVLLCDIPQNFFIIPSPTHP